MAAHKYTAGARTRNVVNIANPGGTDKAYELTAANAVPSAATDGFKNLHSQKMLHVLIHNNGLNDSGVNAITVSDIAIWGYNSSLGGKWHKLTHVERTNNNNSLIYPEFNNISVAKNAVFRVTIPIHGIERIAVRAETFSHTRAVGTLDIYLGVNSI